MSPQKAQNPDYNLSTDGSPDKDAPKQNWYMINPPPFSPRIERQSGKFTYHPIITQNVTDDEDIQQRNRELVLICINAKGSSFNKINTNIRRELGIMNIHHGSMFPEHSGIARFINYELDDLSPKF